MEHATEIHTDILFAQQTLRAEGDAVLRLTENLGDEFLRAVDVIVKAADAGGSVVVTGMGKSGLIGAKISATLASLGIPSHCVHPADAVHGDLGRIRPNDCVLALSYSGSTDEVVAIVSILRQDETPIITITSGKPDTPLARLATVSLGVGIVEEACPLTLAPTTSTTVSLALGDALALVASRRRSFTSEDFAKRHPGGWLGDMLRPIADILRFRVGDNLPIVGFETSVADALNNSSKSGRRPGAMLIVDETDSLVGIFTDGDLRRLVLKDPADLERPIEQVMTRSPRSLPSTSLVRDAVQLVREHRQDEIPVVDSENRPVGLLDVQDLIAMRVVTD